MTATATATETSKPVNTLAQPVAPARELRPQVDIYENAEEVLLLADVPGASKESVNVRVEEGVLSLEALRTLANGQTVRYQRAFHVPESVDPEKISAELKHGVLHLHLRKAEKAKPRTIAISAN